MFNSEDSVALPVQINIVVSTKPIEAFVTNVAPGEQAGIVELTPIQSVGQFNGSSRAVR